MGKVKQNQVSKKKQQEKPRDTKQTITVHTEMGKWDITQKKVVSHNAILSTEQF